MDTVSYVSEEEWHASVAKFEALSKITKAQNRAAAHAAQEKKAQQKELATALAKQLAAIGIYALYGGTKGHGFWLYRGITTDDDATIRAGHGFYLIAGESLDQNPHLTCITNNGKASGNEHFWPFKSAQGLLSKSQDSE